MKKKSFALLLAAALLLCLLPGMALEAKAETIRNTCPFCYKMADLEITGFDRFNDDYHYVIYKCPLCGTGSHALFVPISLHSGGTETPTCTTGKTCTRCGTQYGKLGHDWGAWQSRGNNSEHFRTCQRDGCDAMDTQAAPATAVRPASPWEHALPAAGSTTAHMPSLRLRTGIRMPKTTGLAAPSATKRKLRWAHISSFRAPLARALSPQPPAFLRPCTTQTALTATTRERILMYPHGNDLTRTTTTWCTTTRRRPPAPKLAGMNMTPASARAALTPPRWKSLR